MKLAAVLAAALLLTACPNDDADPAADAGELDAGELDAALTDAALPDAPDLDLLDCPDPAPGRMMICGQVHDLADGTPVPRQVVRFYDALAYLTAPQETQPLLSVFADATGRFASVGPGDDGVPETQFVLVLGDDSDGVDLWLPTGVAVAFQAGSKAWTHAFLAGHDGAFETYAAEGVAVAIFARELPIGLELPLEPSPGVKLTFNGSVVDGALYLGDEDPRQRTQVVPRLTATGVNGTAISRQSPAGLYSGSSSNGCTIAGGFGATAPGTVFVQLLTVSDCSP